MGAPPPPPTRVHVTCLWADNPSVSDLCIASLTILLLSFFLLRIYSSQGARRGIRVGGECQDGRLLRRADEEDDVQSGGRRCRREMRREGRPRTRARGHSKFQRGVRHLCRRIRRGVRRTRRKIGNGRLVEMHFFRPHPNSHMSIPSFISLFARSSNTRGFLAQRCFARYSLSTRIPSTLLR